MKFIVKLFWPISSDIYLKNSIDNWIHLFIGSVFS